MWTKIQQHIQQMTGREFVMCDRTPVSGGSINQAYHITDGNQHYFVKLNQASKEAMFEAEVTGLQEMHGSRSIRVPKPLGWGTDSEYSYIIMEWIPLGHGKTQTWFVMGQQLAQMHRQSHPQGFGWHRNNTIGNTPQLNSWMESWGQFFAEQRIGYQVQLAQRRGGYFRHTAALIENIPILLAGHHPVPSLVHGDLWLGNAAFSQMGEPILLDPATYYGDREVDIAMTTLFGGFPLAFYQGYQETWPLAEGYQQRQVLYNLYHILNHFNLFGGGYASQAQDMIDQVLVRV
jgi:fructosamine-3-kinase